jgi:uncharacterized protein involved in exopolysaccharide biosynthesis
MAINLPNKSMAVMQTQNNRNASEQQAQSLSDINLSEYSKLILNYRKLIGYIVGATFILSVIVSLLLPKMYVATARVLPPQKSNSGLSSLLDSADNPLGGLADSLVSNKTPVTLYVGIMKSRSAADALIQKFKLKELYNMKYNEDVYDKLANLSTIEISKKDKIINVSVKDRDPQRAADLANAYVDILDQINRKLNITRGKRKRFFLEGRLHEVKNDLEKAEIQLKTFQEKYNLVAIEEQAKVAIEGAAEIKGQIIAAETELQVLKQFGTEKQIEAVMLKAKIEELTKQLGAIEQGDRPATNGSAPSQPGNVSNFYIPFDDLPQLGLQLMRLMRETKIQEKLFELITSQYEMARIEEAQDFNTIQILDKAVPPEKKLSPKRGTIVISSCLIAVLFSVLLAFFLENTGHLFFHNQNK